jgi:hypothetical protein
MRKGGFRTEVVGWVERISDWARSGLEFKRLRFGRAAGAMVCTSPAIGTFAELDARTDIKAVDGAMGFMLDRGSYGSAWVVLNGAWVPDGPIQGIGTPEGVLAAPQGSTYRRLDGTAGRYVYRKVSGTGTTGWVADPQGLSSNQPYASYNMVSATPITLGQEGQSYFNASDTIASLPVVLPVPISDGQVVDLYFAQRVRSIVFSVAGQDSPSDGAALQDVTIDSAGLPAFALAKATIRMQYQRSLTRWRCAGVWNAEELPDVADPVREHGAVADGVTYCTAQLAASLVDANQAAQAGFNVGKGGTMRLHVGVFRTGRLTPSRWVNIKGQGIAHTVLQAGYDDVVVAGEDGMLEPLDDGTQQSSIVCQQEYSDFSLNGKVGLQPAGHIRHGIWLKPAGEAQADRAMVLRNLHAVNMPGSAFKIQGNDQVRAINIKGGGCDLYTVDFEDVSDSKMSQLGFAPSKLGNRCVNCASLELDQVDAWLDDNFEGDYLWQWLSCTKSNISDGEWEGPVLFTGDNHRSYGGGNDVEAGPDSKSAFQHGQNRISINFKVSEDYKTAKGVPPRAHLTIKDLHGTRLPFSTFGYKLGFAPSAGQLAATPDYLISIDTQMSPSNPNYAQALANSGQVDVSQTSFIWHFPKLDASGVPQQAAIVAARLHVCDRPDRLLGVRVGVPKLKRIGHLAQNEIAMAGQLLTSDKYPLLYLFTNDATTPNNTWQRQLTDVDGSSLNYRSFTLENPASSSPPPTGFQWVCEYEQ